jgi:hypothetical protein
LSIQNLKVKYSPIGNNPISVLKESNIDMRLPCI